MRFRIVLILCAAALIGACDEKGEGEDGVSLSAPERVFAGRDPDLGRADYRSQRGWKTARNLTAAKGWFGAGEPRALPASTAPESLGDRWRRQFDGAAARTNFNRSPVPAATYASRRTSPVKTTAYQSPEVIRTATSAVSLGRRSGYIKDPVEIPFRGVGYQFLANAKGDNYGTHAMGLGVTYLAAAFKRANPGHPGLTFGDVSDHDGGQLAGHKSHRYGRDIDIYFAITDANGRPVTNNRRIRFNADGRGRHGFIFDDARNWQLVKGMLENPYFGPEAEFIFISKGLKARVLAAAKRAGASPALYHRAKAVMSYWPNHNNHFHLRIKPSSRALPIQA